MACSTVIHTTKYQFNNSHTCPSSNPPRKDLPRKSSSVLQPMTLRSRVRFLNIMTCYKDIMLIKHWVISTCTGMTLWLNLFAPVITLSEIIIPLANTLIRWLRAKWCVSYNYTNTIHQFSQRKLHPWEGVTEGDRRESNRPLDSPTIMTLYR